MRGGLLGGERTPRGARTHHVPRAAGLGSPGRVDVGLLARGLLSVRRRGEDCLHSNTQVRDPRPVHRRHGSVCNRRGGKLSRPDLRRHFLEQRQLPLRADEVLKAHRAAHFREQRAHEGLRFGPRLGAAASGGWRRPGHLCRDVYHARGHVLHAGRDGPRQAARDGLAGDGAGARGEAHEGRRWRDLHAGHGRRHPPGRPGSHHRAVLPGVTAPRRPLGRPRVLGVCALRLGREGRVRPLPQDGATAGLGGRHGSVPRARRGGLGAAGSRGRLAHRGRPQPPPVQMVEAHGAGQAGRERLPPGLHLGGLRHDGRFWHGACS
mmetsp:Transcript_68274/g.211232  ORF Transcript_68274/g.211232 Transcript_68274/m.211232 type:complete len:321 (+) Transcript_68274:498-1460(+)